MNILIACEESQRVVMEFRKKGHNAYSCDLLPCSGGFPEWHIQGDVLRILNGNCEFHTMDKCYHYISGKWDMIIAFPPCTYLTVTGNKWFDVERFGEKAVLRHEQRKMAVEFFMKLANADCDKIAIENPVGVMSTHFRKPNQIIHPYYFGDAERKRTCLWLKNIPELVPTDIVEPNIVQYKTNKKTDCLWHMSTMSLPPLERAIARSKTFPGIARAMAQQWG